MSIRDEELIAYLLGEGDAELADRVEAALEVDSAVASRLQELRAALGLLDSLKGCIEPPMDLTSRTLSFIDQAQLGSDSLAADSASIPDRSIRLRPSELAMENRSRHGFWDSAFLTVSIAAMACLLLPLMLQGRSYSRQAQCANNLRLLGEGVTQLAMLDPEHRFPAVPSSGLEGFAGRYAMKLQDIGSLSSPSLLRCVSMPGTDTSRPQVICVPTTQAFLEADAEQQALWRTQLGGDYAYIFGVIEKARIVGPKLEGRAQFAILADAPQIDADRDLFYAHEGRGFNVYYEDGHVGFLKLSRSTEVESATNPNGRNPKCMKAVVRLTDWSASQDYPFRNWAGQPAYGLSPDDAALGPSSSAPMAQR